MNVKIGLAGEQLAVNFIKQNGYCILERNYRNKFGEIDIIAKSDNTIIFIEVKTRTSTVFGIPSEAVTYSKQKTINKVSQVYILQKKFNYSSWNYRFDVIEVMIIDKKYKVRHIENAF